MTATFETRERASPRKRVREIFGDWLTNHWQKVAIAVGVILLFGWVSALLWLLMLLLH